MTRLVTADTLCKALQTTIERNLETVLAYVNDLDPHLELDTVTQWLQLPTLEALTAADYPVGAITSPGLVERPTRRGFATYDATWRLVAGVYDHGDDHDHTAARSRTWAAVLRATILLDPSLGGAVESLTWVGEELDRVGGIGQARTLGAGVIAVDVHVKDVINTEGLPDPSGPPVTSTHVDVHSKE